MSAHLADDVHFPFPLLHRQRGHSQLMKPRTVIENLSLSRPRIDGLVDSLSEGSLQHRIIKEEMMRTGVTSSDLFRDSGRVLDTDDS